MIFKYLKCKGSPTLLKKNFEIFVRVIYSKEYHHTIILRPYVYTSPMAKNTSNSISKFQKKNETLVELRWRHDRIETTRHERNKNEMKKS